MLYALAAGTPRSDSGYAAARRAALRVGAKLAVALAGGDRPREASVLLAPGPHCQARVGACVIYKSFIKAYPMSGHVMNTMNTRIHA